MRVAMIFPSLDSEKPIAGYSITLCKAVKKAGVDIDMLTYKAKSFSSFLKLLPKLKNYDVIHLQHEYNLLGCYGLPFFPALILLKLYKKRGAKIIITMHTVLSKKEKYLSKNLMLNWGRKNVFYPLKNRLINRVSNFIILHAGFFKDILIREYGFKTDKIDIMPQGILENIPKIGKEEAKRNLGLSGPVYLLIGSFVPAHGHDIIIKQARKIGPTILTVINPKFIGTAFFSELKDYVGSNNLNKIVKFEIKDIKNDMTLDWWKYFYASDIVLLPYRGGIGSGIFAHAIAAERPMIGSNIQYFREFSKSFKGIIIAKTDEDFPKAIKEAMNPQKLKKMEDACKEFKREFGMSSIGRKYKRIYESLIM